MSNNLRAMEQVCRSEGIALPAPQLQQAWKLMAKWQPDASAKEAACLVDFRLGHRSSASLWLQS